MAGIADVAKSLLQQQRATASVFIQGPSNESSNVKALPNKQTIEKSMHQEY